MTRAWPVLALLVVSLAHPISARADGDAVESPTLRVGTSGDYAPFSFDPDGPEPLDGFDVELARRFASDSGRRLEFVRFTWPELATRLGGGDFDVAMSGVTVRPDRSLVGRFTTSTTESAAVLLLRRDLAAAGLDALDHPDVRLAVNAGGHLERAARARFPSASVRAIPDNAAVVEEVRAGRADAAVTDTREASHWLARAPELVQLGPFTRDRKAFWVRPQAEDLAVELDRWLARREADGTLARVRARWLAESPEAGSAAPLSALVAALDERLSLMPYVAEAKRSAGRAVRDPAQEARVVAAALQAAPVHAEAIARPAPGEACVRSLFEAQIDAASALQEATLARAPTLGPDATPDLNGVTRPALARLNARILEALAALPTGLEPARVRAAVEDGIRTPGVRVDDRNAISEALVRCANPPTP